MKLATRILIGMLVGLVAGITCNYFKDKEPVIWFMKEIAPNILPLGHIFLNLIFMVVIPLVFSAIVVAIAEFKDIKKLGSVGLKTLFITIILASISVVIGIAATNLIKPGEGLDPTERDSLSKITKETERKVGQAREAKPFVQVLVDIIPKNPIAAAASGDFLGIMFFALIFGIALNLSNAERTKSVVDVLQGIFDIAMKIITFAMAIAPFAVALLVFPIAQEIGVKVISTLGKYMLTVILGLAIHMFIVYSLVLRFMAGVNPLAFFKKIKEVIITAFSTSSSNATLPISLKVGEEELKIPKEINRFVLTVGATANQNGTALYEGVTILFLAQVFGANLSIENQIMVVLMTILAGIGTAGVPGGSLPYVASILITVGIRPDTIALILGVDRILDMCRTTLNVTGDLVVATYISSSEGTQILKERKI